MGAGGLALSTSEYILLARKEFAFSATAVAVFVALAGIDILTGLLRAFVTKKLSSSASWIGMAKKTGVLLVIAMCSVMDPFVPNINVSFLVAFGFCVTEALSIIENVGRVGVKIPKWLKDVFVRLQEQSENKDETQNHN